MEVAIVGGGIVGAACAWFLAGRGARPLLLEAGRAGRAASGVNAGGVRQQGRLLPEMPLALESVRLWAELEQRLEAPLEYERCGDLRVAETPEDVDRLRQAVVAEERAGLRFEWLEGAALGRVVPGIAPQVLAGSFCPTGGQANPLRVAATFARRARQLGAEIWENCPVTAVARNGRGLVLETARGRIRADRLVLAAGPWTPGLAAPLGVRLPIGPVALQMLVTGPLPRVLGPVLLGVSRRLSLKQAPSGVMVIGGGRLGHGDLARRVAAPAGEAICLGARDAAVVLPVLARAEAVRAWAGLEGRTPDELPIIDRLPGTEVYVAAGFSGHGFALGPVVGRLLSEWLLDGRPSLDLAAFRVGRFEAGGTGHEGR